jgi:hypothetical protein
MGTLYPFVFTCPAQRSTRRSPAQAERLDAGCVSPKLPPACIFNNFIKLLAARSFDVTRRLRRSQLRLPNPVAASLSVQAHPLLARVINFRSMF